jgi:hypothetical protein
MERWVNQLQHGVMNHPSACTIKAIHDYFNDGTLPKVGTTCEPDQTGFQIALEVLAELTGNSTIQKRAFVDGDIRGAVTKHGSQLLTEEFNRGNIVF